MIWSFRVLVAPAGVELRPRRSQEVKGSQELQNGGLRALEEAWDDVRPASSLQTPGCREKAVGCRLEERFSAKCSTSFPGGHQVDGLPPV